MLFVWIGLWTVGLLLLVTDPKRRETRWISSIALTGGSGGLSAVIHDTFVPMFENKAWYTDEAAHALWLLELTCSRICYYGLPYTFLMFAIVHFPTNGSGRLQRLAPLALLVPLAASFAFEPRPDDPIPYDYVTLWTTPYIIAGIVLLVIAAFRERNSFLRKTRMLTMIAAAPTLLFAMFTLYILPTYFGVYEYWRYNAWVIAFTLAVILVSSLRYGFMGLQISIRNQKLDYTLRAITSGTAILNHAIKNDVGKIKLFSQKIKAEAEAAGNKELCSDIEVVMAASQHIYDMIYRIQGQTQEVELHPEELRLDELALAALQSLEPELQGIRVAYDLRYDKPFVGDKAQLSEVLTNVLSNAVEAMPQGGELRVKLFETKRGIVLEVKDTGVGMDKKQIKRMFDPFYTTKTGKKMNFGLGLSYCYNVIQKHKGGMDIDSKPGQGTTVFIHFSKKRKLFLSSKGG